MCQLRKGWKSYLDIRLISRFIGRFSGPNNSNYKTEPAPQLETEPEQLGFVLP